MENLADLINIDYFMRVTVAVVFGFCIGLERELTNKYAGLRTHILVCLGACVFTLISIYGFPTFAIGDNVDPGQATGVRDTARVAAQIVTGIGFIGAGTVLRNGPIVLGLTTAATLWIAASIGMACGAGMFDIAFAGTVLAILTLVIVRLFERYVLPNNMKRTKRIEILLTCNPEFGEKIQNYIFDRYDNNVIEFSSRAASSEINKIKLRGVVDIDFRANLKNVATKLQSLDGVESVSLKEFTE